MATAKIGGSSRPWRKRQTIMPSRLVPSAISPIGITTARIAGVITRLRPITSASAPGNGAGSAIAAAPAVINAVLSAGPDIQIGNEKQTTKRHAERRRRFLDAFTLARCCEDCIHDGRMASRDGPARFVRDAAIDPQRRRGRVGRRWQRLSLGLAEQRL